MINFKDASVIRSCDTYYGRMVLETIEINSISDCTSSYFIVKLFRLSSLTVKKCLVLLFLLKLSTAELIRTMADFKPCLLYTSRCV